MSPETTSPADEDEQAAADRRKAEARDSMENTVTNVRPIGATGLTYVWHPDFETDAAYETPDAGSSQKFMHQTETVQWSKAMHYAAHRWAQTLEHVQPHDTGASAAKHAYETTRNMIVTGNYNLIFGVMNKLIPVLEQDEHRDAAEDALLNAAQKYNPWFAVRFNTYATWAIHNSLLQRLTRPNGKAGPRNMVSLHSVHDDEPNLCAKNTISYTCKSIEEFIGQLGLSGGVITQTERTILQSYFFEDQGPNRKQIAEGMAMQINTVTKIKNRSLEKLRSALEARDMDLQDLLN